MKPFTHWAIHHQQKIRIAGRDQVEIWGLLAGPGGAVRPVRYDQQTLRLTIGDDEQRRVLQLDIYGFEQPITNADPPVATCRSTPDTRHSNS